MEASKASMRRAMYFAVRLRSSSSRRLGGRIRVGVVVVVVCVLRVPRGDREARVRGAIVADDGIRRGRGPDAVGGLLGAVAVRAPILPSALVQTGFRRVR